jgi:hypothetical protein
MMMLVLVGAGRPGGTIFARGRNNPQPCLECCWRRTDTYVAMQRAMPWPKNIHKNVDVSIM